MALTPGTFLDSLRLQTNEVLALCKRALCDVDSGLLDSISAVSLEERVLLSASPIAISAAPVVDAVDEFRVNVTTADSQETSAEVRGSQSAVAIDESGNYVAVWSSANQDGSEWGVYARRFDASGSAITGEILVAETSNDDQHWARVASDEDGNFVVVWTSSNQDGTPSSIYGRRFDAQGSALIGEFRVNTHSTGSQTNADIAMDEDGNFVVIWQGEGPSDANGIYARRFDDSATAIDAVEFQVNELNLGIEENASVAMQQDGDFVVAWQSAGSIRARQFSSDGMAVSRDFRIGNLASSSAPDVAYHESGEFTVVWSSDDPLLSGVYLRKFDNAGVPIGILSEVALGEKNAAPSIATDSDGDSIVVWECLGDGNGYGVFARKVDSSGSFVGSAFQINQTTVGDQHQASVAMIDADNFVVVWSGRGIGDADGVFARQFGTKVVNQPPSANSGGRYTIDEGDDLVLDGSGSSDPNSDLLSYAWDLDNDGIFGEASEPAGPLATVPWSTLQSFGITNDGDYTIGLQVSDGNGGMDVATTTLKVVNVAPFISSKDRVNLPENTTTVLTVTAADPVDSVTFSISGGKDQSQFLIDAVTGQLTFITPPDFELPADSDGDNVYEVEVTADDGAGKSPAQQILVTIEPVNDNSPVFTTPSKVFIDENSKFVQTVNATDADLKAQTITYSISGGSDAALFGIDGSSGALTFLVAPDFESPADSNGDNVHEIEVTAFDNDGNASSQQIRVTVQPINEVPVFAGPAQINLMEDGPVTELDWSTWFVDPDIESLIVTIDRVADSWLTATVDPSGNLLCLASDADVWGTSSIVVRATDATGSSTTANVSVDVRPVNDTVFAASQNIQSGMPKAITGTLIVETVDVDGESLTPVVTQSPTNGQLTVNTDGSFTFTPDDNFAGIASFRFVVDDGVAVSNEAEITLSFSPAPAVVNAGPSISIVAPEPTNTETENPGNTNPGNTESLGIVPVETETETGAPPIRSDGRNISNEAATVEPDSDDSDSSPVVNLSASRGDQDTLTPFQFVSRQGIDFQSQLAGSIYESVQSTAVSTAAAFSVIAHPGLLWNELDSLWAASQSEKLIGSFAVGSVGSVSSGLIVGYVIWALRSGLMLSSIVATMPAWNLLDPLAIIPIADQGLAEDGETLADIVDNQQKKFAAPSPA